jgi:dTMP kinase
MRFITFEGSEDCGKSNQVKRLVTRLAKKGIPAVVFREPGGTVGRQIIRHLLRRSEENRAMTPETELLLFEASRAQLVPEKIQPALMRGDRVICDRFLDSPTVYQGAALHLDSRLMGNLNVFAVNNCFSDLTFILDIDRAKAQSPLRHREKGCDRIEEESDEFQQRVIGACRDLAGHEANGVVLVDGGHRRDGNLRCNRSTFSRARKTRTPTAKLQSS